MLKISLFMKRRGYYASKLPIYFFTYKVHFLSFAGEISIANGNTLIIATTYQEISVPYMGPEFH